MGRDLTVESGLTKKPRHQSTLAAPRKNIHSSSPIPPSTVHLKSPEARRVFPELNLLEPERKMFPNVYAHRKVADTASKGCDVCYRPTTSVLFADGPDGKDFFYVCASHLKDRNFCSPIIDQAAIDARKKKELDEEVERVKKEYEEKKKKKKEEKEQKKKDEEAGQKDDKDKDKDKGKDKDKDKSSDSKDKNSEDETDQSNTSKTEPAKSGADEPRVFALHRTFYQQRVEKKRQMEVAKRNRERLQQPNYFPSVPKGLPGT